jgi:hypothetical protein
MAKNKAELSKIKQTYQNKAKWQKKIKNMAKNDRK